LNTSWLISFAFFQQALSIVADVAGTVIDILCNEGQMILAGQGLCLIGSIPV
jgi:urea carboxylase